MNVEVVQSDIWQLRLNLVMDISVVDTFFVLGARIWEYFFDSFSPGLLSLIAR